VKKYCFLILALIAVVVAAAQPDTVLGRRLEQFMEANRLMNIDRVLDYTYPKLFTIATRNEMADALKTSFDNDAVTIVLDSVVADSVYPVFRMREGSFAKIRYSMKMIMRVKGRETDSVQQKKNALQILAAVRAQYGPQAGTDGGGNIVIHTMAVMVAVKDAYAKEWCFVNLKEEDPVTTQLFSNDVLARLATYH